MKNKMQSIQAHSLLPDDAFSVSVMKQRSLQLAKKLQSEDKQINWVDYIKFKLGNNELYGAPFSAVKEVIDKFILTPVPHTQNYIAGVMNWRGQLLVVINMVNYLQTSTNQNKSQPAVLVVESKGMLMGILMDDIEGSDRYDPSQLVSIDNEMLIGVDKGIVCILNIQELFSKINHKTERRIQ